jgi:peroxiredoxin
MQIRHVLTVLCATMFLTMVGAFAQTAKPSDQDGAEVSKPAPDFELKDLAGKTHKLSDYQDKIVVLEWWNQDCPVSRKYIPTMKKLAAKYAEKGVVWLGIDSTHYQTQAKNQQFVEKQAISYPILLDTDGKVGRQYGAKTTPHMFVINQGTLAYTGAIDNRGDRNYVDEALEAILAGRAVPLAKTQPFGCSVTYKE